jgi:hypothetical protein
MKTLKVLAVAVASFITTSTFSNADSWGFALGNGGVGFAYSGGGRSVAVSASSGGGHCHSRPVYVQPARGFVNPYMPNCYGPREYYINGQPYVVYPTVRYLHR